MTRGTQPRPLRHSGRLAGWCREVYELCWWGVMLVAVVVRAFGLGLYRAPREWRRIRAARRAGVR